MFSVTGVNIYRMFSVYDTKLGTTSYNYKVVCIIILITYIRKQNHRVENYLGQQASRWLRYDPSCFTFIAFALNYYASYIQITTPKKKSTCGFVPRLKPVTTAI